MGAQNAILERHRIFRMTTSTGIRAFCAPERCSGAISHLRSVDVDVDSHPWVPRTLFRRGILRKPTARWAQHRFITRLYAERRMPNLCLARSRANRVVSIVPPFLSASSPMCTDRLLFLQCQRRVERRGVLRVRPVPKFTPPPGRPPPPFRPSAPNQIFTPLFSPPTASSLLSPDKRNHTGSS